MTPGRMGTGAVALLTSVALQTPVFLVRRDVVTVSVSVKRGNNPVRGLKASDFGLLDNGVQQHIESVEFESVPVDVTLFLDTSGSTAGALRQMVAAVRSIVGDLTPGDRYRVLTIGLSVRESVAWTDAGEPFDLSLAFTGGISLIYDALAAAVRHDVAPGRRHVVIALTDGRDCGSIVEPTRLLAIAQRSEAVLHWVEMGRPGGGPDLPGASARCFRPKIEAPADFLSSVAQDTGGGKHSGVFGVDPVRTVQEVLADFRQSYVLTFTPSGVPPNGWHALKVQLRDQKDYAVRARAGYGGS